MAQHINTNQLHPAMVNQIPMLQAAGLNLTVSEFLNQERNHFYYFKIRLPWSFFERRRN